MKYIPIAYLLPEVADYYKRLDAPFVNQLCDIGKALIPANGPAGKFKIVLEQHHGLLKYVIYGPEGFVGMRDSEQDAEKLCVMRGATDISYDTYIKSLEQCPDCGCSIDRHNAVNDLVGENPFKPGNNRVAHCGDCGTCWRAPPQFVQKVRDYILSHGGERHKSLKLAEVRAAYRKRKPVVNPIENSRLAWKDRGVNIKALRKKYRKNYFQTSKPIHNISHTEGLIEPDAYKSVEQTTAHYAVAIAHLSLEELQQETNRLTKEIAQWDRIGVPGKEHQIEIREERIRLLEQQIHNRKRGIKSLNTKELNPPKVNESYFATCKRDKEGHCVAKNGPQTRDQGKLSKYGHMTWDQLKKAGHNAQHVEHIAAEWTTDHIDKAVAKLPSKLQKAVRGTWVALRIGLKTSFASYTAAQAMAEQVAKAKGATAEQARALRAALTTVDIATFKPLFISLEATGVGAALAGAATFVPVGSASYLAYSTATDPLAVLRAAKEVVKAGWSKLHRKNMDDSKDVVARILDVVKDDRWLAILMVALDETGDLLSALRLVESISKDGKHTKSIGTSPFRKSYEEFFTGSFEGQPTGIRFELDRDPNIRGPQTIEIYQVGNRYRLFDETGFKLGSFGSIVAATKWALSHSYHKKSLYVTKGMCEPGQTNKETGCTPHSGEVGPSPFKRPNAKLANGLPLSNENEHILRELGKARGPLSVGALHRSQPGLGSNRAVYTQTAFPAHELVAAGLIEKVGLREGHILGIGASYAGPGSASPNKVEADDPIREIYQLTEKGHEVVSEWLGMDTKPKPKPVEEEPPYDPVADYRGRKQHLLAVLSSAKRELERAKGKPNLTRTAQQKIKKAEEGLRKLGSEPVKSLSYLTKDHQVGTCKPGQNPKRDNCVAASDTTSNKPTSKEDKPEQTEKQFAPPPDGEKLEAAPCCLYEVDPHVDTNGDGIADHARVGVPAMEVPPPPKEIPRLPNLTEKERAAEARFADAFLEDPDGVAKIYRDKLKAGEIGDGPNVFSTDDAKLLSPDYNPKNVSEDDVKTARGELNVTVHQTANAIAKRAFLQYLDEVVKNSDKKTVLVTCGGVAAGKGFALKNADQTKDLASNVGAVYDSAGEQNSTENPWILEECKKRDIIPIYAFVHANPTETWENPKRGVVERANNVGRMVSSRLFADSYSIGVKNFKRFYDDNKDGGIAEFIMIDNSKGKPAILDAIPEEALTWKSDDIASRANKVLEERADKLRPSVVRGGMIGDRIWGNS